MYPKQSLPSAQLGLMCGRKSEGRYRRGRTQGKCLGLRGLGLIHVYGPKS